MNDNRIKNNKPKHDLIIKQVAHYNFFNSFNNQELFNNQIKLEIIWVYMINFPTWHVYDSILTYLFKIKFYMNQIWVK